MKIMDFKIIISNSWLVVYEKNENWDNAQQMGRLFEKIW